MFAKTMRAGFSLVELMIYITVVGLLLAAAVPAYRSYQESAARRATQMSLHTIKQAILQYQSDVHKYPETLRDLMRKPYDDSEAKKWHGPYLDVKDDDDELPLDGWHNEFVYHRGEPGSGKPFELYSDGPEGEGGPEEDRIYG